LQQPGSAAWLALESSCRGAATRGLASVPAIVHALCLRTNIPAAGWVWTRPTESSLISLLTSSLPGGNFFVLSLSSSLLSRAPLFGNFVLSLPIVLSWWSGGCLLSFSHRVCSRRHFAPARLRAICSSPCRFVVRTFTSKYPDNECAVQYSVEPREKHASEPVFRPGSGEWSVSYQQSEFQ
jgi:hypothetical protein